MFAINDDNFVDIPVYGQTKSKEETIPLSVNFRVTEEELHDLYEHIQEKKYDAPLLEDKTALLQPQKQDVDPFDKWVDSDDEFSPSEYVDTYYGAMVGRTRESLKKLQKQNEIPVRVHPHIHELYMSYLVRSMRKDPSVGGRFFVHELRNRHLFMVMQIIWDKFRLHERNRTKDIELVHLKNALEGLMQITPKELLQRWVTCALYSDLANFLPGTPRGGAVLHQK